MNPTLLAIAVPVLIFSGGCAVILRRKISDYDVPLFREPTGRHTPEAVALASMQALRPVPPFPGGTEPAPAAASEPAPPWDQDRMRSLAAGITNLQRATDPAMLDEITDVIDAAVITSRPPEPEPEPGAYWLAAGTYSADGQVRTVRVELLPPVEELLGHASTGDAVAAMSAGWHSVESLFNGHHVRQVRALTDGAP